MTNFSLSPHLPITTYIQIICFRRFTAFVFLEEIIEFFAVIQVLFSDRELRSCGPSFCHPYV